jgi:predicted Fe-Mo cluster-binding NifX family protein
MKIVVSAKGATPESDVDPRFGRASCFLVFDTGSGAWQSVDNAPAISAAHGAGIQSAETVCGLGAEIVISGHVGPKAFTVLAAGGVKVYQGDARTARQAVEAFQRGQLPELSDSNRL